MLLDSNIVIYAAQADQGDLRRRLISLEPCSASAVSLVEVLGYHALTAEKRGVIKAVFAQTVILPITDRVIERAILLRQLRRMKLGDSLIAATALVHRLMLMIRNTRDFSHIEDLELYDPFG